MSRPIPLLVMIAVLASCTPIKARSQSGPGATAPVGPAKSIVSAVLEASPVCSGRGFGDGCGPLLVDLASFRDALVALDSTPVETWFPVAVQDLPADSAYKCRRIAGGSETSCMMLHSSVHTDVVGSHLDGELVTLDVRWSWDGASRTAGGRSGMAIRRYEFAREGAAWRLQRIVPILST
jgi:hypothetical protein